MSDIQLIRLDHYERWLRSEGIPVRRGLFVEDVNSIDLAKWQRMGGARGINKPRVGLEQDVISDNYRSF